MSPPDWNNWREAAEHGEKLAAKLYELVAIVRDRRRPAWERLKAGHSIGALYEGGASATGEIPAPGWLRLSEVAARSGVAARTLRRACERGDLPASKRNGGGLWMVDVDRMRTEDRVRLRCTPKDLRNKNFQKKSAKSVGNHTTS